MFLTFVSSPKDQDADVRFPSSEYGNNECRCRTWQQCSIHSLAFFRGVVVRFRKAETYTNVPQRHNTLQTMAIEVREGQAAAARQMAQGAAASSRISAVSCVYARGGKFEICGLTSRQHLEKTYLVPTPFRWIIRSWKLSEPTFVSTCSVHRSYCRRILYTVCDGV